MKLNNITDIKSKIENYKISFSDIKKVVNAIKINRGNIRIVGGMVRDLLLKQNKSSEIDLVTNLDPSEIIDAFKKSNIEYITVGLKYGCITAKINGKLIEITSLRKDVENDGRWPVVEYTKDWKLDAKRRDFTINSIYIDFNGNIYDSENGIKDLKNKKIIFIGNPVKRIKEDYLRILRFFRFTFLYSKKFHKESFNACIKYKKYLRKLSFERRFNETSKLIMLKNFEDNFSVLDKYSFFEEIFETSINKKNVYEFFKIERKLKKICQIRRIKFLLKKKKTKFFDVFSKKEIKRVQMFFSITDYCFSSLKKKIYLYGRDNLIDQLIFDAAENKIKLEDVKKLIKLIRLYDVPKFPISGNDIKALGIKESQEVGYLKKKVENWWLEKGLIFTKEECIDFLKKLPACKRG